MKSALFINWTDKPFTGYWNGKGKTINPGEKLWMPDYLAKHFAKHLANRELLSTDANGNLIYKDGEKMTSPKKPEEAPLFLDLFNKAIQMEEDESVGEDKDNIDALINIANKNRQDKETKSDKVQDPTKPQVIEPAGGDEDDEEFEGKPVEIKNN